MVPWLWLGIYGFACYVVAQIDEASQASRLSSIFTHINISATSVTNWSIAENVSHPSLQHATGDSPQSSVINFSNGDYTFEGEMTPNSAVPRNFWTVMEREILQPLHGASAGSLVVAFPTFRMAGFRMTVTRPEGTQQWPVLNFLDALTIMLDHLTATEVVTFVLKLTISFRSALRLDVKVDVAPHELFYARYAPEGAPADRNNGLQVWWYNDEAFSREDIYGAMIAAGEWSSAARESAMLPRPPLSVQQVLVALYLLERMIMEELGGEPRPFEANLEDWRGGEQGSIKLECDEELDPHLRVPGASRGNVTELGGIDTVTSSPVVAS